MLQMIATPLHLSPRYGPRPKTSVGIPYVQLDQWPLKEHIDALLRRALALPEVGVKESRLARPEVVALWIPDECASQNRSAFIDDHEFCHMHPAPDGSIHLTLPAQCLTLAIKRGWAEIHPLAREGFISPGLALVYAPRSTEEVESVMALVTASYRYARGEI